MPYPNEHAMRLNPPGKYARIRRQNDKFGDGIDAIFGVTGDGKVELQAIRFDKSKFTPEQAKKWLKDHDYSVAGFEPAKESMNESWKVEGTHDLPWDKDSPWSFDAADGNAILEKGGWPMYRRAHLLHDDAAPEVKASYKLPVAKLKGGTLTYYWSGVTAARQRLAVLEGVPADAKSKVVAKLDALYRKAGRKDLVNESMGYGYRLAEAEMDYGKAVDKAITALEEGDADTALKVLKQCRDRKK